MKKLLPLLFLVGCGVGDIASSSDTQSQVIDNSDDHSVNTGDSNCSYKCTINPDGTSTVFYECEGAIQNPIQIFETPPEKCSTIQESDGDIDDDGTPDAEDTTPGVIIGNTLP